MGGDQLPRHMDTSKTPPKPPSSYTRALPRCRIPDVALTSAIIQTQESPPAEVTVIPCCELNALKRSLNEPFSRAGLCPIRVADLCLYLDPLGDDRLLKSSLILRTENSSDPRDFDNYTFSIANFFTPEYTGILDEGNSFTIHYHQPGIPLRRYPPLSTLRHIIDPSLHYQDTVRPGDQENIWRKNSTGPTRCHAAQRRVRWQVSQIKERVTAVAENRIPISLIRVVQRSAHYSYIQITKQVEVE